MNTGNFQPPKDGRNPYSSGLEKIQPSKDGDSLYSARTEAFQAPYQPGQFQPSGYPPQPQKRRTFRQWYRVQTKTARILLGCLPFYLAFILCTGSFTVYEITHPQPPAQTAQATSATNNHPANLALATKTPTTLPATLPTATPTTAPTPTPKPTATPKPTPKPTAKPTQPPPPTPCPGVNCNPWGYNFTSGNYITSPPSSFCSYFNCISNFWNGRGFVNECNDGTYSKSGGISGDCSYHGGEMRPLYSH